MHKYDAWRQTSSYCSVIDSKYQSGHALAAKESFKNSGQQRLQRIAYNCSVYKSPHPSFSVHTYYGKMSTVGCMLCFPTFADWLVILISFVTSILWLVDDLAWDWVNQKLYWSDYCDDDIEVYDPNTAHRRVLIDTGANTNPSGIVVDPARG